MTLKERSSSSSNGNGGRIGMVWWWRRRGMRVDDGVCWWPVWYRRMADHQRAHITVEWCLLQCKRCGVSGVGGGCSAAGKEPELTSDVLLPPNVRPRRRLPQFAFRMPHHRIPHVPMYTYTCRSFYVSFILVAFEQSCMRNEANKH